VHVSGKSERITSTTDGSLRGRTVVWAARAVWLAVAVVGGAAFADALHGHSRPVQVAAAAVLWTGWALVALGLMVPSTVALTVVRAVVPCGALSASIAAARATDAIDATAAVALCLVMCAVVASGELGEHFVQASAYGDERRFPLRPPVGYIVPTVVSWCLAAACLVAGPLALAARAWLLGSVLCVTAVAAALFLAPRFHLLSKRWLVLVPAGIVIHDPLVLADTVMIPIRDVDGLALAYADTQAADLTGPASGHALELQFRELQTVVFSPTRQTPGGRALHVRSALVAPSRPGRALAAAKARHLSIG
jgi:hypothetical protein